MEFDLNSIDLRSDSVHDDYFDMRCAHLHVLITRCARKIVFLFFFIRIFQDYFFCTQVVRLGKIHQCFDSNK